MKNRADRSRDGVRCQPGGGHLIEQRLEQMIVVPINHRDIDGRSSECARRRQSAKAAADNDHAGPHRGRHRVKWFRHEHLLRREWPRYRLFHEPTVADDKGLAGQRVRLRCCKEEHSLGDVFGRRELAVDGFPQHHIVDD